MSEYIAKLASEGRLSAEEVERIGQNVAAFRRSMDDPEFQKEAYGMAEKFVTPIAAALTLGLLQKTVDAGISSVQDKITHARDYKKMMDANPDLGKHDVKAVHKAFSTLHKFNPAYASDPTVAGQFVQNTIEAQRMDIGGLNQIVKAHTDHANANRSQPQDLSRFLVPQQVNPHQAALQHLQAMDAAQRLNMPPAEADRLIRFYGGDPGPMP